MRINKFTQKICLFIVLLNLTQLVNAKRPNILFCISDDQSYAHTGANGDTIVKTPAFDKIAREGIRFTHAFVMLQQWSFTQRNTTWSAHMET